MYIIYTVILCTNTIKPSYFVKVGLSSVTHLGQTVITSDFYLNSGEEIATCVFPLLPQHSRFFVIAIIREVM